MLRDGVERCPEMVENVMEMGNLVLELWVGKGRCI